MKKISALENSITSSSTSRKFDIYDSIRTAISAIPIRFVLKNVIMTEDESNTTDIPWSYSVTSASEQYFGVANVSKYIMSFVQVALGDVYDDNMPFYLKLLPGLDDPFNKDSAIKYIQATEDEITLIKAKDATGEVKFKVWIERKTQGDSLLSTSNDDFILSCDNESAVYENDVLSFTGDGMIMITPCSGADGTLHIEDSAGNTYVYDVDVVSPHNCVASDLEVIVEATSEHDGFAVHSCDICGEIMDIEILQYTNFCEAHNFSDWITESEATCSENGVQYRVCSACGYLEYSFSESSSGHTVTTWSITKEATCFSEGEKTGICDVCGNEVIEPIEMLSHTEGDWVISKTATAFETGLQELHCAICGSLLDTAVIPMTDETFGLDLSNESRIITGLPEGVTPDMLLAHYNNMGMEPTITSAEGITPEFVGTGCMIVYADTTFTVVLKGDVNGDGLIDVFDLYIILGYINSTVALSGTYYDAGRVCGNEDIDIFDFYSELEYINNGSFFD